MFSMSCVCHRFGFFIEGDEKQMTSIQSCTYLIHMLWFVKSCFVSNIGSKQRINLGGCWSTNILMFVLARGSLAPSHLFYLRLRVWWGWGAFTSQRNNTMKIKKYRKHKNNFPWFFKIQFESLIQSMIRLVQSTNF